MGTTLYSEWEEIFVSNEKGNREVEYYLKRRDGKASDLAVVGKERSARHMSYSFVLRSTTPSSVSIPHVKLKSRREVLDCLSSVVSDSSFNETPQLVGGFLSKDALDADTPSLKGPHISNLGLPSKEFLWLGPASTCRKRRKHYRSFCRNGITISVHDFVYVLAEENKRLVAYMEDLYEDSRSNRMVVVRWFHKIDEVGIDDLPPNFNDREIFFSLCLQDLSVECIDGLATILCPQHFDKYLHFKKHQKEATGIPWQPFLCYRQFDNDDITDFNITQVQGYWKQELLRYMYTASAPKDLDEKPFDDSLEFHDGEIGDDEDTLPNRPRKKHRRSKSKEIHRRLNGNQDAHHPTHVDVPKVSSGLNSPAGAEIHNDNKEPNTDLLSKKELTQHTPEKHLAVDSLVEVLSQDSGIRGCWFRAVIIKKSRAKIKVRYQDLKDAEDESKNVEEWVLASRFAAPDGLGIRLCGRTTVRPFPSCSKDGVSLGFVDVGTSIDAWWHDGWWEGIVVLKESDRKIHVYFPGEKKSSIFDCNDLRRSQDWLCNKWNEIECRPDLASSILRSFQTKQDEAKSCDGGSLKQPLAPNDRQLGSNNVVKSVTPKIAYNHNAPCLTPQSDIGTETTPVPNLAKDNFLTQLRWTTSRKRRRGRERSQRWSSGSSSSSREDLETSPDCQRYLAPNSLKFDHESCKYQGDSLLSASIPTLLQV